jgi:hypothetical protein
MTEQKVEYRYPTDAEAEVAWEETHRTHRQKETQDCVHCLTCGLTYWRRRKP